MEMARKTLRGLALASLLATAGCAQHERQSNFFKNREDTPTIGTDPNTVPAGQTIPPAGLGVDLI